MTACGRIFSVHEAPVVEAPTPQVSMRSALQGSRRKTPVVGMAVDATMGPGRGILRGVLRYANARRKWLLHEDFHAAIPDPDALPLCDGVIISAADPSVVRAFAKRTRYVVNCAEGGDKQQTSVVSIDSFAVGRMAADHLIGCQLKNFAYYSGSLVAPGRLEGFQSQLAEAKHSCIVSPCDLLGIKLPAHQKSLLALVAWLQSLPKPVGIFACDDMAGRELAAACRTASILVPDEVAILGVNNDDLLCESAWPPISSVEVDFTRVGYVAAQQLDALLSGEPVTDSKLTVYIAPRSVVRRQSTHLLAVDDPDIARALAHIRDHACGRFSVGDLLRAIPLTRRTLERRFVEKLGRTPHEEITRVRVEMAQRLLRETDGTLPKIAERCGFAAPQALNYMFRKILGETPATYRRLHRRLGA